MMLPEDMRLWVGRDHFVWFLIDVIEGLDTTALEAHCSPGKGPAGYDPRMLAVLLIYAYCQAERSSRRIEERCRTDAAFRVATGNLIPDHSTICRFRAAAAHRGGPLEDLFTRVLFVLAVAGLGRLEVISVDGSKIWADASKQANRTEAGLRKLARKILDEAARADGEGCACASAGHEHGEAVGLEGPDSCGCCDGGMLPGLGLDGPAVPRGGWGGAPRAQRIASGLANHRPCATRRAGPAGGRGGVPGRSPRRDRAARAVPADVAVRGRGTAAGAGPRGRQARRQTDAPLGRRRRRLPGRRR